MYSLTTDFRFNAIFVHLPSFTILSSLIASEYYWLVQRLGFAPFVRRFFQSTICSTSFLAADPSVLRPF